MYAYTQISPHCVINPYSFLDTLQSAAHIELSHFCLGKPNPIIRVVFNEFKCKYKRRKKKQLFEAEALSHFFLREITSINSSLSARDDGQLSTDRIVD